MDIIKKIKVTSLNLFIAFGMVLFTKIIKVLLANDALKAFFIFHATFLSLIIVCLITDHFFSKIMNCYIDDRLIFGLKGWLANFIDFYFILFTNWYLMLKFLSVKDFFVGELFLFCFAYYYLMYVFVKRTPGLLIVGLRLNSDDQKPLRDNLVKRAALTSMSVIFLNFWVLGIFYLIAWIECFWKRRKTLVDFVSRTSLSLV